MTDMHSFTHTKILPPLAASRKIIGGLERTWLRTIQTTKVRKPRKRIVGTK
jgi:hypothetical protein